MQGEQGKCTKFCRLIKIFTVLSFFDFLDVFVKFKTHKSKRRNICLFNELVSTGIGGFCGRNE